MDVKSAAVPPNPPANEPFRADDVPLRLDGTVSRRTFLGRAAAVGISASIAGGFLAACEQVTRPTPSPTGSSRPTARPTPGPTPGPSPASTPSGSGAIATPVVEPTPLTATYGPMLEVTELVGISVASGALRALLAEVASEAGVPVGTTASAGSRQARLTVATDDRSIADQAYRLEIAAADDGPTVTIRAGGDAGAFYGLLSLAQLVVVDGPTTWLRTASIDDAPGFARRGAILDPAPRTGVSTPASRAELLERVRLGVRHKLNFVDLPSRTPWPDLVRYCADHHVELMVAWGYQDQLTRTPRQQVKDQLAAQQDAGARSISLNWDDISATDPDTLAQRHAEVLLDLYGFLRGRDRDVRVSVVLPPYGGVPGQNLVSSGGGQGERYLEAMRSVLPDDVRVFWTGDGGVFSETVTTAGAAAYRDAIGHEIGLWDNDTIRFSRDRRACSGRAPDLQTVVPSYMGNLAGEANWAGTNGEFALLTSLFYTWNPAAYEPATAAASADAILTA